MNSNLTSTDHNSNDTSLNTNFAVYPVNLTIGLLFMFLNPVFALPIVVLISLSTKKVNNLWLATLYSISFSLLFFNQDYTSVHDHDVETYIRMYHNVDNFSYIYLIERYFNSLMHNEFIWFYFMKIIGTVSGYNTHFFVFTTYLLTFSLSAYLTYQVSKTNSYYFPFLLFCLIFVNLSFQYNAFRMWRHTIGPLLFIIGMVKFNLNLSSN